MSEPSLWQGRFAAAGRVLGPAHRLPTGLHQGTGRATDLGTALEQAALDLTALMETAAEMEDGMAAEILAFQLALIEDDALAAPALEAIEAGRPAPEAWHGAMAEHIAPYEDDPDPSFQSRAEDLRDLRDRVARRLIGADRAVTCPRGAIILAAELVPSEFVALDGAGAAGIALESGSPTSHVAILARARGLPLIVRLGEGIRAVRTGERVYLDGAAGRMRAGLSAADLRQARREIDEAERARQAAARLLPRPAMTADGERVDVAVNIDGLSALNGLDAAHCDGVGLVRTEFLFGAGLPDEASQLAAYRQITAWAGGRPVTFRTLDAGGDKPIEGLTVAAESNPFLGVRGLRLSLLHPDIFAVQLRALLRLAAEAPMRIMFPMVTAAEEFERAVGLVGEVLADLAREGVAAARPKLGMMIEVPAAAFAAGDFAAEFYSIGTNDLVQYMTAASRDDGRLADLCDPAHPGVRAAIAASVAAAGRRQIPISVCGDMAADPKTLPTLLGCGVRSLSVAPAALAVTKAAIAEQAPGALTEAGRIGGTLPRT